MFIGGEFISHGNEAMHSLNILQSFTAYESTTLFGYAKYSYKPLDTENIMDYSHYLGKSRFSTGEWQAKIVRKPASQEK